MFSNKWLGNRNAPSKGLPIYESNSIRDLLRECSFHSFVAFDLDNTVMTPLGMLGNDAWYDRMEKHLQQHLSEKSALSPILDILNGNVHEHIKMRPVDPDVVRIIKLLQDIGIPVIGLTARGPHIIQATIKQLKDIGIDFSKEWGDKHFPLDIPEHTKTSYFKNGIVFCNDNNKGECLKAFLEEMGLKPDHVAVADDKKKHLERVLASIGSMKTRCVGIRYGKLDNQISNLDMVIANEQLLELLPALSSETRNIIEKFKITSISKNNTESNSLLSNSLLSTQKSPQFTEQNRDTFKLLKDARSKSF